MSKAEPAKAKLTSFEALAAALLETLTSIYDMYSVDAYRGVYLWDWKEGRGVKEKVIFR